MNTEQERADFEMWWDGLPHSMKSLLTYEVANQAYELGRAALQSKPIESAAREIALWAYGEVGADPELTPGLAQLLHHFGISDDVPVALQSQDREDESCKWHNCPETDNVWDTDCGQSFDIYEGTPTENRMGFCCYCGKPIREAIDYACRVEEEGE